MQANRHRLFAYFLVSLCSACFRQNLQYLLISILSGLLRLFFIDV